jgi:NarL family two-component system response regulator LiaR
MSGTPIRVAVVNDYELVVVGIAGILQRFPDQIDVVELDSGTAPEAEVDVVLYDSFGQAQGAALDIASLVGKTSAKVVVFSWNTQPDLVEQSLAAGAAGYISKSVSGDDLVKQIASVHAGDTVVPHEEDVDGAVGRWPGDEHGLSPREAEVLALICQGLSNDDICNRAFLSINTVKTYVRTLYRKIGVDSRTQAVLWGIDHGFRPDHVRHRLDTGERDHR